MDTNLELYTLLVYGKLYFSLECKRYRFDKQLVEQNTYAAEEEAMKYFIIATISFLPKFIQQLNLD